MAQWPLIGHVSEESHVAILILFDGHPPHRWLEKDNEKTIRKQETLWGRSEGSVMLRTLLETAKGLCFPDRGRLLRDVRQRGLKYQHKQFPPVRT